MTELLGGGGICIGEMLRSEVDSGYGSDGERDGDGDGDAGLPCSDSDGEHVCDGGRSEASCDSKRSRDMDRSFRIGDARRD
jgi:hypothetical protein